MLTTLLNRYEFYLLEQDAYFDFLNDLNDTIKNITNGKKDTRTISSFFGCSSFADFLTKNLNDLEFKREVKVIYRL